MITNVMNMELIFKVQKLEPENWTKDQVAFLHSSFQFFLSHHCSLCSYTPIIWQNVCHSAARLVLNKASGLTWFISLIVAVYLQWAVNNRGRLRDHLTKLAKQVCALSRLFSLLLFILLSPSLRLYSCVSRLIDHRLQVWNKEKWVGAKNQLEKGEAPKDWLHAGQIHSLSHSAPSSA